MFLFYYSTLVPLRYSEREEIFSESVLVWMQVGVSYSIHHILFHSSPSGVRMKCPALHFRYDFSVLCLTRAVVFCVVGVNR